MRVKPAVELWPLDDQRVADLVLAGHDVERPDPVLDPLRAVRERLHRDGLALGAALAGGEASASSDAGAR